ncbi:hypothetical protein M231_07491 [Tremella mesenterica]|uniref:Uncharacterized protein n=1 Tax=Tremella mesenterica TaxID=5217 RepID=A0A4Q1BBW6_TREME|nr:hypothetical protein M231_07491 [Tremella mesenterica]
MAPSTPTPNSFAAMRNFGGMVSSALSFGDRSRQVSSLGLGTLSLGEPSGAASPPRSASPSPGSPSPASGPPGPRRRKPAFRPGWVEVDGTLVEIYVSLVLMDRVSSAIDVAKE